jgi:hypothetical protein
MASFSSPLRYRARFGIGSRASDTDAHPHRVSRQIGDRHILHIDRLVTVARRGSLNDTNLGDAARGRDRFVARQIAKHLIGLAADLRDPALGALAQSPWGTRTISEIPDTRSGTRNGPPPTATSDTSPASVFMRSMSSFSLRLASASAMAGFSKIYDGGVRTVDAVAMEIRRGEFLLPARPLGLWQDHAGDRHKSFRSTSLFHEATTLARLRGDDDQSADGRAAAPNGLSATAQPRRLKRRRHNRVPQRRIFAGHRTRPRGAYLCDRSSRAT